LHKSDSAADYIALIVGLLAKVGSGKIENKGLWFKVSFWYLPGWTEKTERNSVRLAILLAEVHTFQIQVQALPQHQTVDPVPCSFYNDNVMNSG